MYLLQNEVRDYPWGSTTVLPDLLGSPADGTPQAELWIGAHPDAPSKIIGADGSSAGTLDKLVAADPVATLGNAVSAAHDGRLPFLLKVLAVERPLSLQAHPSLEQARRGFAAEEAAGVDPGAPDRTYGDDNHKPELLWAVTEFDALCGFRPLDQTVELLRRLDVPALSADVDALADGTADLGDVVERWLSLDEAAVRDAVKGLGAAATALAESAGDHTLEAETLAELASDHPDDGGVLVAALLNRVRLQPGQAIFSPAGSLHAYLHGTGVELMASSDNVLRGGLTSKHVDVPGLLAILDRTAGPAVVIGPRATPYGEEFRVPVPDFALSVLRLDADRTYDLPSGGPQLLLTIEGSAALTQEARTVELPRGRSAFVGADEPPVQVAGEGVVVRATVGGSAHLR